MVQNNQDQADKSGMMGGMPAWMMSTGSMADMMQAMMVIHALLVNHDKIRRQVENIPKGIHSMTVSDDPDIARAIQTHVFQMRERIEKDEPIRQMDPLFQQMFQHHKQIHLKPKDIQGGVEATESSDDPQVVLLIRDHAHNFVSQVVADGMQRAMQPTPLPQGYHADDPGRTTAGSME